MSRFNCTNLYHCKYKILKFKNNSRLPKYLLKKNEYLNDYFQDYIDILAEHLL